MFESTVNSEIPSKTNGKVNGTTETINEEFELHNVFSKLLKYCLLIGTFLVVTLKIYHSNRHYIEEKIFTKKLIRSEWTENGLSYFTYSWQKTSFGEPYLLPFLFSLGVMLFTWGMVYLDSRTPGENPPSPFSKSRYRSQSFTHPVHVGYLMAILSGIVTFGVILLTST